MATTSESQLVSLQMANTELKEDQCTIILHFADRPEVRYEVEFSRNRYLNKKHLCWPPPDVSIVLIVLANKKMSQNRSRSHRRVSGSINHRL